MRYVYADESGNFDFSLKHGATRFLVLTSVTFDDRRACHDLDDLKYELAWEGGNPPPFHASENPQHIRDRVFECLGRHEFQIRATIFEKRKAHPTIHNLETFYRHMWRIHLGYLLPRIADDETRLLIVSASIGTKKREAVFGAAVRDAVEVEMPGESIRRAHWPANSDYGLQIADYCSWAIYKKWESGDERSYRLIRSKIESELDVYQEGQRLYY